MLAVRLTVSIIIATLASLVAPTATDAAQSAPEPEWSLDIDRIGAVETVGDALFVAGKVGAYPFVSRYDRDGMEVWTRVFGSFGSRATALAVAADGPVFVSTSRAQIYEFTSNGDFVAAVASSKLASVTHLSLAADGSLYAAGNGESDTGFTFDLGFLTRFDAAGVEQWTVDIDHGPTSQSEVRGIAALTDGSVVVLVDVMTRGSSPTVLRTSAAGYDSSSRRIWEVDDFWIHQANVVPPLEGEERTTDVVAFPGGGFLAVGNRMGGTVNGSREVVVRLSDSSGVARWTRELGDPDLQESSTALSVDEQGQIIVFGSVGPDAPTSSNQTALTFTAISHDGSVRWSANLDRQPGENSLGLASGSTSDLFFASTVYQSLGGGTAYDHAFLRRLDASGLDDQTVTCEATLPHPFLDLVEGSRVADDASCLYGVGVTTGTSATTYGPDDLVTREQMAAFLARLQRRLTTAGCVVTLAYDEFPRGGESYVKLPFVDVGRSSFAFDDIGCIFANELTTGTSSMTYGPGDTITREQMAAFLARLYRLLTGDPCSAGATPFTDVSPTSFAAADIACIYSLGITTGTSETTYDPGSSVTRGQMASFLARLYRGVI